MLTTIIITKIAEETPKMNRHQCVLLLAVVVLGRVPHSPLPFSSSVRLSQSIDTSNPSASIWVPGGGLNLICSTLSPSSEYVACSDPIQTKLYKVQPRQASSSPNQLQVTKVQVSHLVNPASAMVFSAVSATDTVPFLSPSLCAFETTLSLMNEIIFATLEHRKVC